MTRTLSRSAAHEIGHYLLRSGAHAPRGLMRERMTVEEIMDDAPALYRLLPGEIASLHQRRAGALADAPASDPRRAIRRGAIAVVTAFRIPTQRSRPSQEPVKKPAATSTRVKLSL